MSLGGKQRQIRIASAVERQFRDLPRVNHLPMPAGVGFQGGGHPVDFDRFRDGAHLQWYVNPLPRVHVDSHVSGVECRESLAIFVMSLTCFPVT
jgi:hypothetical protein